MTDRDTSREAIERAHLEALRATLKATEELHLGSQDKIKYFKSIFPTFDINVPMPADTAVPGSYGTGAQETTTGTFFRRRKRTTD